MTLKLRDYKTTLERCKALETELKVDLSNIGSFSLDERVASSRNCENMIGVSQIPMGVAGPLVLRQATRDKRREGCYVPLATTEGALVASVNRGCKAIAESKGAAVDSYRVGVTRGPVFLVKNLKASDGLNSFLEDNMKKLQQVAAQTSGHLTLTKCFSRGLGRYRYVRFIFDSNDAMGMNMATIASTKLAEYIAGKTGAACISVAGNYDTDKKPSWLNSIEGRGIKVWAEAVVPASILRETLKTSARKIYDVWLAKCMIGSAMAGSIGFNAQYANIIAAVFAATGQDLAHVGECSTGITTCEIIACNDTRQSATPGEALYVSVYLPDLMVGTVGGGTGLATQKEALSVLGVAGGNDGKNSQQLAEIIAGAVLAGELSLLASLAEGTLAEAHQRLARGAK